MTAFDPPFAGSGERRAPTPTEKNLGFPCGPASQALFNYLFWRLEGNVDHLADQAGVTAGSEGDLTVLFRSIEARIQAYIGETSGEDPGPGIDPNFVLLSQARTRLPIYPEVRATGGRIVVTSPSTGTVRVPAGTDFLHRGIFLVTTTQTDLNTDASKTYHLRWNPTDGFALKDLADSGYNPGTLPEGHASFDSTYDDMLVARVVTNSSNVATITNLSNLPALHLAEILVGTNAANVTSSNRTRFDFSHDFNWSRTPRSYAFHQVRKTAPDQNNVQLEYNVRPPGVSNTDLLTQNPAFDITRYRIQQRVMTDRSTSLRMLFSGSA